MAKIWKIITFYARFTPSYSAIGYYARRPFWRTLRPDLSGQTWLVNGGSEGVGAAAARAAAQAGATVIAVARNPDRLREFATSVKGPGQIVPEMADFSLQSEVDALLGRLQARGVKIDVLVNNVGCMLGKLKVTSEGLETSFVTNLQSHYLLTRELISRGMLTARASVIEVSSGGMYNQPLLVKKLNDVGTGYEGVRAYGLAKRGQVVLTRYWRKAYGATDLRFYAMHPGWADTVGVRRSMPRFRKILKSVLRTEAQGADTVNWLAAARPDQAQEDVIWFDRKERTAHIYPHTPNSPDTAEDLVAFLEANTQAAGFGEARAKAPA